MKKILFLFFLYVLIFSAFENSYCLNKDYIIIIKSDDVKTYSELIEGFKDGFDDEFNYDIEIINIKRDWKIAEEVIDNIKKRDIKPPLILMLGLKAAYSVQQKITDIPLIFCAVLDWEHSLQKKNNTTGISMEIPALGLLEQYKFIKRNLKNIGIVYSKENYKEMVDKKEMEFKNINANIIRIELSGASGKKIYSLRKLKKAFNRMKNKIDCLLMVPDFKIINTSNFNYMVNKCKTNKIPFFAFEEGFVKAGALASLSPSFYNIGSQANFLAKKILLMKIPPAKIKVLTPIGTEFILNSKTADKLGLNIKLLKQFADKVY